MVAVLLTTLVGGACRPVDSPSPNVVLIVLDTFRADRLGARPGRPSSTPHLDALAARGRRWRHATAVAPLTMPSMAAVFTGRYPDAVGIVGHGRNDRIATVAATMPAIARDAGYETLAVITNPWLARPATGFTRGFDSVTTGRTLDPSGSSGVRLPAASVRQAALDAIDAHATSPAAGRPVLLWAHFMDAHMPYQPAPMPASSRVIEDFTADNADRQTIYFEAPYAEKELAATRRLYDAAIATIDREIGRLLGGLDERGVLDHAVVVVLSDHGEALGDHGLYFAHDFNVYEELVRSVLMIRADGLAPGVDGNVVSLVDVLPTLCALTALVCPRGLDGVDLSASAAVDAAAPDRAVFSASAPRRQRYDRAPGLTVDGPDGRITAVRRGNLKLIRSPSATAIGWQAYDLASDPGEVRDIHDAGVHAPLERELESWIERMRAARARLERSRPARPLGHRTRKELRALGYLD